MKIFSFCLYGYDIKYYDGIKENIKIIKEYFPKYNIYIYIGKNYDNLKIQEIINSYDKIKIIYTNKNGVVNMLYRYIPLLEENLEIFFSRDADSYINDRDRYCINEFIKSDYKVHTIRDHYWHKSFLTGGLTGFKKIKIDNIFSELEKINEFKYGDDEKFLNKKLYPLIKNLLLVHTNICAYKGEKYNFIEYKLTEQNFCGNVIENNKFKFKYANFNLKEQIRFLDEQKQNLLIIRLYEDYKKLKTINNKEVYQLTYPAYFNTNNLIGCMNIYKNFYKYDISNFDKTNSNFIYDLARRKNYSIIGTCDLSYEPHKKEIVIYFGSFPDDYMSLPQSNKIYKNVYYINKIKLDNFIYDKCWDNIDKIYIIGLENETDRYINTLYQLSLMNAPLNNVYRYCAKKDKDIKNKYIGATKNHVDCIKDMIDNKYKTCLFLEDDFMFSSDFKFNKKSLEIFFKNNYNYNICFLSASKFHKREDFDNLLILSKQSCTTSSGYLLNSNTVSNVFNVVNEGYEKKKKNPSHHNIYCIDRYWSRLNNIFIFKRKLGYQMPSVSNITGKLNISLD